VLSELVNCGVDWDARTRVATNETCSNIAIVSDNADALRLFLLAGANVGVNGTQGTDHEPLLHTAVVQKNFTCAMLLLAAGADVATCDRKGRTACLLAALESSGPMMSFVHAMLAVGADLDAVDGDGKTPRLCLAARQANVEPVQVAAMRREIAKTRLDFVRYRALEVCVSLQPLQLDALQLCEILQHLSRPVAHLVAFHQWWKIATTVKHFKSSNRESEIEINQFLCSLL
jgi:hypothetical protein